MLGRTGVRMGHSSRGLLRRLVPVAAVQVEGDADCARRVGRVRALANRTSHGGSFRLDESESDRFLASELTDDQSYP